MKTRRHSSSELKLTLEALTRSGGASVRQMQRLDAIDAAEKDSAEWDVMNDEMKRRIDERARSRRRSS